MAKIPPQARAAYKGQIFTVYEWPQTLYDGSTATFEAVSRLGTVNIVATQGAEVLYARQEQPGKGSFISLFGGRVEEGEEPLAAAKRELLEEAGLEAESWELLSEGPHMGGKINWPRHTFLAKNCRQVAASTPDAGEKIEILRTPISQFFTNVLNHPEFRDAEVRNYFYSAFNQPLADAFLAKIQP